MDQEQFNDAVEEMIRSTPSIVPPIEAAAYAFVTILLPYTEHILILPGIGVAILYIPEVEDTADYMRERLNGYFGAEAFNQAVNDYVVNTVQEEIAQVVYNAAQSEQPVAKQSPYAGGMYLN